MLRHIISKVKIFSDWCSVGTDLDCPPPEVLFFLASLSLWIFPGLPGVLFFLDVLGLLQVIRLRFPGQIFFDDSGSRPQMPQRRFWAVKVRRRRQSGPWAWHGQGFFHDYFNIQFNPTLLSLSNYNDYLSCPCDLDSSKDNSWNLNQCSPLMPLQIHIKSGQHL